MRTNEEKKLEQLYTETELMQMVKLSRHKIWQDRKAGRLTFLRIGNTIRYRLSDIENYINS